MHLEYKVIVLHHDFVVGSQQKHKSQWSLYWNDAPGRNVFNPCEKRVVPWRVTLSCNINILNRIEMITIDPNLEWRNFKYKGWIIAEIWNASVINIHPEEARYLKSDSHNIPNYKSEKWTVEHDQQLPYLFQIFKCLDSSYCDSFWSSYPVIVKDHFPVKFFLVRIFLYSDQKKLRV